MCEPSTLMTAMLLGAALAAGADARALLSRLPVADDQPDQKTHESAGERRRDEA